MGTKRSRLFLEEYARQQLMFHWKEIWWLILPISQNLSVLPMYFPCVYKYTHILKMGVIPYILYYSCFFFFPFNMKPGVFHVTTSSPTSLTFLAAQDSRVFLNRVFHSPVWFTFQLFLQALLSHGENTLVCAFVYLLVWTDSETRIWYFHHALWKLSFLPAKTKSCVAITPWLFSVPPCPLGCLVLNAIYEMGRMHPFFRVQASDAPLIADV